MGTGYFALKIVKQPNGKFAIYDTVAETFKTTDFPTAEKAKERILKKMEIILQENVTRISHPDYNDDLLFHELLDKCRKEIGLPSYEGMADLSFLESVGLDVKDVRQEIDAVVGNRSAVEAASEIRLLRIAKSMVDDIHSPSYMDDLRKNYTLLSDLIGLERKPYGCSEQ